MSQERLIYLPLGGAGEIGMNAYVYGYGKPGEERLIVVDLGVAFPDMDTTPGVDLIFADVAWLEARRDRIEGIIITHAHEDHIGAIGHLWPRLRAPIYARKFTGLIAAGKLEDTGAPIKSVLNIVEPWPAQTITMGPFSVGFLPISHSIPESAGLIIDTPKGRILHTGDFKIDVNPVVGEAFDEALWSRAAEGGVKALMCDSTNIFSPHAGRSESTLSTEIENLIASADGMVVATTFASNVARLKTIANAATAAGRRICLLGRAMRRMVEAALETGILTDFPAVISPEEAADMPRHKLLLLVTGSQGERRAASAQLANGSYLGLKLKEGDLFLFSSKTIPGNERGVIRIMNMLSEKGVDIVDDAGGRYHVSGHANRPDLQRMHRIVNPKLVVPMHGEHRHLREHVKLAEESNIPGFLAVNGMMLDLTGDRPQVAEYIDTGRTYLDGSVQIGAMDGVVRDRIRMALNGHVTVTLIIDEHDEPLGDPWCETMGLAELGRGNVPVVEAIEAELAKLLRRLDDKTLLDDDKLEKELRKSTRNAVNAEIGHKPEVTVIISRLV
ncbi:ribonuclease J [Ketogulonicigenium vulgare]|uniref:Metallo-beta-lactamase family protein n=1 Tax=Ketogulonicigenium vulgare (strain WSH-001) TaxID=759362 RepID=F9Y3V6_KETVW|nr:ribonuclease J [Ketogulonicigenium vulgare]ADO43361.1 metallo-beta-lactamase family protein [Ketogulonicigenium vulgare Y25]AEM41647.1 Metallo-beta-lactamase family protein [Ketogulonicigenium vulgare WSH-001]ALJ81760.1 MBL fold metallo-hydrolase [Ketogulonicigenium vulgare]ANW34420.1 MBL fold hydrolase [Ketogulonicigenium vulgare]AOZ55397.1 metallo-beta-lactamase family protein [Ketogulonicigenium vulgare]